MLFFCLSYPVNLFTCSAFIIFDSPEYDLLLHCHEPFRRWLLSFQSEVFSKPKTCQKNHDNIITLGDIVWEIVSLLLILCVFWDWWSLFDSWFKLCAINLPPFLLVGAMQYARSLSSYVSLVASPVSTTPDVPYDVVIYPSSCFPPTVFLLLEFFCKCFHSSFFFLCWNSISSTLCNMSPNSSHWSFQSSLPVSFMSDLLISGSLSKLSTHILVFCTQLFAALLLLFWHSFSPVTIKHT